MTIARNPKNQNPNAPRDLVQITETPRLGNAPLGIQLAAAKNEGRNVGLLTLLGRIEREDKYAFLAWLEIGRRNGWINEESQKF